MDGYFKGNNLVVDLEIQSPTFSAIARKFPIGIDTGFTNDLCLTYQDAFPLALTLVGVQEYTIADGTRVQFFECIGVVKLGEKATVCTISIRPNGSALMGVSLMRKLGLKLDIDFVNNTVKFSDAPIPKPSTLESVKTEEPTKSKPKRKKKLESSLPSKS